MKPDPAVERAVAALRNCLPREVVEDETFFQSILRSVDSTPHFARTFMPALFSRPFAAQHKEVFDALDDPSILRLLILAPRGAGKTTDLHAFAARNVLFGLKKFLLMVGASQGMMEPKTEDLKEFLRDEELVVPLFGRLHSPETGQIVARQTRKDEWETLSKTVVWAKGAEQRIRGALVHGNRPDLILLDDLENDANIDNAEWRAKIRRFLRNVLEMMIDVSAQNYKIVYIATMLHHDCAPAHIIEEIDDALEAGDQPRWKVVRFDLCDEHLNSLWPSFMTTEQIKEEYTVYEKRHELDDWYRERRNIPSDPKGNFTQEMFKYYNDPGDKNALTEQEMNDNPLLHNFILVDPSRTTKAGSSEAAIVGGAIDIRAGKIYHRDEVSGHLDPAQVDEEIILMAARLNSFVVGVEVAGLGLYATQNLKNEIARRALNLNVVELHPPGGIYAPHKDDRIRNAILPYYNRGMVYHNRQASRKLQEQLLTFPKGRKKDVIDAWSYFPELFTKTDKWMVNTSVIDDADELAFKRLMEDERKLAGVHPDYLDYGEYDEEDDLLLGDGSLEM